VLDRLSTLAHRVQKGLPIEAARKSVPGNVVNLMEALRASIGQKSAAATASAKRAKAPAKKSARSKKSA
jgi:DNA end-binding protein Ku